MEFHFSIPRLLLLIALLAIFAAVGGFTPPAVFFDIPRVAKAWRYCVLMFISGAACVSVIDHFVGNLERMNIRLLYIIMGIVLMIVSYLWFSGLRSATQSSVMSANNPVFAQSSRMFS
jgi:hypothetical protein